LCRIATTLASRLGPEWRERADDLVRLVERYAGIFSVISPGDAHSPLAYLARMLDKAVTCSAPDAQHTSGSCRKACQRGHGGHGAGADRGSLRTQLAETSASGAPAVDVC
jgi:hypothetical protein